MFGVSLPKTSEQIEKLARKRALIFVGAVAAIFTVSTIISSISDSVRMNQIRTEVGKERQIEKQTSIEAGTTILPELRRYADIIEGKLQTSASGRKKESEVLRKLADLAKNQSAKVETFGFGRLSSAKYWSLMSELLVTDAQVIVIDSLFTKMKLEERTKSANLHRKTALILQKQVDEGFEFTMDLYDSGVRSEAASPVSSGSHSDFIRETWDLPSSVQHALDKIYKADPARARELSRQAHEAGVQNLPNQ
jgi:hypothetical protein